MLVRPNPEKAKQTSLLLPFNNPFTTLLLPFNNPFIMASIFSTNKPKRFEHISHFTKNERKQWLEARVRKVKREMGELPDEELKAEEMIRGTFIQGTKHLKRRKEKEEADGEQGSNRYIKLAVAIVVMIIIFVYLVKSI